MACMQEDKINVQLELESERCFLNIKSVLSSVTDDRQLQVVLGAQNF